MIQIDYILKYYNEYGIILLRSNEKGGFYHMAKSYKIPAAVFGTALAGLTAFIMLDTFVLEREGRSAANEMNLSLFEEESILEAEPDTADTEDPADAAEPQQEDESAATAFAGTSAQNGTKSGTKAAGTNTGTEAANNASATETTAKNAAAIPKATVAPKSSASNKTTKTTTAATTVSTTARATTVVTTTVTEPVTEAPPPPSPYSDFGYHDDNISLTISEYREYDTQIYVADVQLSSAQYLKAGFANDTYGRNITAPTSEIAELKQAIFAVNGDFYGAHNRGYVIRNGVLYRDVRRDETELLCIMADGSFFFTDSTKNTAQELMDMGTWQCFMFGPVLFDEGEIKVSETEEVARSLASNPRTAIGILGDLHYAFVVSDGRTSESAGLSLYQLAEFMDRLGAYKAYNLDGGGSSTMIFNGNIINVPTNTGRTIEERSVSDIVYIGY